MELLGAVKEAIFWSSAKLLFSIDVNDPRLQADKSFIKDFEAFDTNFELASSGLPHFFLRSFVNRYSIA